MTKHRNCGLVLMVGVLLLAAALRLWHVDGRALWFDEGNSLTYARMPLRDLIPFTILWEEVNPPAYRLTLGIWTSLVGTTALTARWMSGWLGVLGAALTYHLGRRVRVGRPAALLAALLVTLSPMQVYYSREAKGYTFVQCFVLVVVALWLNLFPPGGQASSIWGRAYRWGRGIALTLAIWLAIGAHYMSGLLLLVMNAWTLVWIVIMRRRGAGWDVIGPQAGTWVSAQAVAGLGWVPWVALTASGAALGTSNAATNAGLEPLRALPYFGIMLGEIAAGLTAPAWAQAVLAVVLLGLAGLGLLRRSDLIHPRSALLLTWLVGPLALGLLVQIAIPFFYPRFLLYVVPALSLMAALGLARLAEAWRPAAAAVSLVTAGVMAAALYAVYMLPNPSPDLRPIAADLERELQPGDGLIFSYSWQPGTLAAYLPDRRQPVYHASFFERDVFDASVQSILDEHGRVWLLTYEIGAENPINDVGLWLLAHSATPGSAWYGASQLTLFLSPRQACNPGPPTEVATFDGGRIALHYAPLPVDFTDTCSWPLIVALNWEARTAISERYVVFVHLLVGDNPVPAAQQDNQPANNTHPTYAWPVEQTITDFHALNRPDLPPAADCRVIVGLYDGDTLTRLPSDDGGDSVTIGVSGSR